MRLLDEARAAGLAVAIDGDRLVVRGPRRAESVARKLLANKREVIAALAEAPLGPVADDSMAWRDFYEKRAARREHSGHYPHRLAERLAYAECVEAWCRQHPQPYDPVV